jgi:hypothetical protein
MLTQVVWNADMRTVTHEEASTVHTRLMFKAERCVEWLYACGLVFACVYAYIHTSDIQVYNAYMHVELCLLVCMHIFTRLMLRGEKLATGVCLFYEYFLHTHASSVPG